jgi:hypothetical protein
VASGAGSHTQPPYLQGGAMLAESTLPAQQWHRHAPVGWLHCTSVQGSAGEQLLARTALATGAARKRRSKCIKRPPGTTAPPGSGCELAASATSDRLAPTSFRKAAQPAGAAAVYHAAQCHYHCHLQVDPLGIQAANSQTHLPLGIQAADSQTRLPLGIHAVDSQTHLPLQAPQRPCRWRSRQLGSAQAVPIPGR